MPRHRCALPDCERWCAARVQTCSVSHGAQLRHLMSDRATIAAHVAPMEAGKAKRFQDARIRWLQALVPAVKDVYTRDEVIDLLRVVARRYARRARKCGPSVS